MGFADLLAEADALLEAEEKAADNISSQPRAGSFEEEKETRASMLRRHQIELPELEEECRKKLSEAKKKGKLAREMAQTECDDTKRSCLARHEKELSTVPYVPSEDATFADEAEEAEEAEEKQGFAYSASNKKKGKQQKRKDAKAAAEVQRYKEAKDSMKGWVDPKEVVPAPPDSTHTPPALD